MAGNIEERNGSHRIRVSAGFDPVTGKRRVIRKTVHGTAKQAEEERARLVVETSDGKWLGTSTTLADLFVAWLPVAGLAESTAYDYRLVIDKYVNPKLGAMAVSKIRAHHLDAFYLELTEGGLGPARAYKVHTVIRSALKRAVKWRWIATNPAHDASPPTVTKSRQQPPTPEQVRRLLELATAKSVFAQVFIHVASNTGFRRGELCGLQWDDVDLNAGTIVVRRSVAIIKGEQVIKSPKVDRLRDPAPLSDQTVALLRFWQLVTDEDRALTGEPWVFPAPKGGFFRPRIASRLFRDLADAAGLPRHVHLHSLRHYVATQLLTVAGVDAGTVAALLGHSRTSTTVDMYGHPVDEKARAAAEAMARINNG